MFVIEYLFHCKRFVAKKTFFASVELMIARYKYVCTSDYYFSVFAFVTYAVFGEERFLDSLCCATPIS